jgi:hypothetical protein
MRERWRDTTCRSRPLRSLAERFELVSHGQVTRSVIDHL